MCMCMCICICMCVCVSVFLKEEKELQKEKENEKEEEEEEEEKNNRTREHSHLTGRWAFVHSLDAGEHPRGNVQNLCFSGMGRSAHVQMMKCPKDSVQPISQEMRAQNSICESSCTADATKEEPVRASQSLQISEALFTRSTERGSKEMNTGVFCHGRHQNPMDLPLSQLGFYCCDKHNHYQKQLGKERVALAYLHSHVRAQSLTSRDWNKRH